MKSPSNQNSQQLANATVTHLYEQFHEYLQTVNQTSGEIRKMMEEDLMDLWMEAKRISGSEVLAPLLHVHSQNRLKLILSRSAKDWVLVMKASSKSDLSFVGRKSNV